MSKSELDTMNKERCPIKSGGIEERRCRIVSGVMKESEKKGILQSGVYKETFGVQKVSKFLAYIKKKQYFCSRFAWRRRRAPPPDLRNPTQEFYDRPQDARSSRALHPSGEEKEKGARDEIVELV